MNPLDKEAERKALQKVVARNLSRARHSCDMSQQAAGERIGVHKHSVYSHERRDGHGTLPSLLTLLGYAELYGVTVNWLIGRDRLDRLNSAVLACFVCGARRVDAAREFDVELSELEAALLRYDELRAPSAERIASAMGIRRP